MSLQGLTRRAVVLLRQQQQTELRRCLRCERWFLSAGPQFRRCRSCTIFVAKFETGILEEAC